MAAKPLELPAYVQLKYEERGIFSQLKNDASSTTSAVRRDFDELSSAVTKSFDAMKRGGGPSLNLGTDEMRRALQLQQARTAAAEEYASAARRAAAADGGRSRELQLAAAAAEAMAQSEREATAAAALHADVLGRVTAELTRGGAGAESAIAVYRRLAGANDNGTQSAGAHRAAMVGLGQQLQDSVIQLQMGTSALTVFAQQGSQAAFQMAGMGGKVGAVASVMAGPWGAAIFGGTALLGPLISGLFQTSDALADVKFASDGVTKHAQGAAALPRWAPVRWVHARMERFHAWFNRTFERMVDRYARTTERVVERKWLWLAVYGLTCLLTVVLFTRLPTGFLPTEDQGIVLVQWQMPGGTVRAKTEEVQRAVERYFMQDEGANVQTLFAVVGAGQGLAGQNTGQAFVQLKDWSERPDPGQSAAAIVARANKAFSALRDARVYVLVPGAIRGLGQSSGFTMELQNASGMPRRKFQETRDALFAQASSDDRLTSVRLSDLPNVATLKVDNDVNAMTALGVSPANANGTLSAAWGGSYVNDYIEKGRVKKVYIQGDAPYRSRPEDLAQWFVRNSSGTMVPFSSFTHTSWSVAPSSSSRFDGLQSYEFSGSPAAGQSSGTSMRVMEELAAKFPGTRVAWSGSSYQERLSSGQAPMLYGLSLLVVFLCLAALYESWSIPVAVLLVIPLGLLGAILAVTLRGLENDVYMQIGLLTTMGLSAKNAILMIEFAEQAEKQGKRVIEAALEAARIRLRPILMTSFAFIFGVLPLALATGAGANSRVAIGTSVIGGMLTATVLAIFYIPLFFVIVRRSVRDGMAAARRYIQQRNASSGDRA